MATIGKQNQGPISPPQCDRCEGPTIYLRRMPAGGMLTGDRQTSLSQHPHDVYQCTQCKELTWSPVTSDDL